MLETHASYWGMAKLKSDAAARRRVERVIKGFSNHRRIQILGLLSERPEMTLQDIVMATRSTRQATSEHVRKMTIAGLVMKQYDGRFVRHRLTERGSWALAVVKEATDGIAPKKT